ncbi:hypothetical protein K501DRAFT_271991 [Backusella circina FSU 941]|nr:hypothetical protein K501DRAFT_271991 [Backusella circina FSU 941]
MAYKFNKEWKANGGTIFPDYIYIVRDTTHLISATFEDLSVNQSTGYCHITSVVVYVLTERTKVFSIISKSILSHVLPMDKRCLFYVVKKRYNPSSSFRPIRSYIKKSKESDGVYVGSSVKNITPPGFFLQILGTLYNCFHLCQMKKPTCDLPTYKNFKISKTDSKAHAKISKRLNRYPYVKTYANQVNLYLQSADVYKKYMEKFEDHLEKKAKRRSKRKLNNQTQLNSEAEVLLKQKKKFREIETAITKIDILSESSTTSKSLDVYDFLVSGDTATSSETSVDIVAPSVTTTNTPVSSNSIKTSEGINIRDIIHNAAVILHSKYQNNENLTSSELKTMACGLSSILDINSDEVNGSQQSLFDEVLWKKIYSKYKKSTN